MPHRFSILFRILVRFGLNFDAVALPAIGRYVAMDSGNAVSNAGRRQVGNAGSATCAGMQPQAFLEQGQLFTLQRRHHGFHVEVTAILRKAFLGGGFLGGARTAALRRLLNVGSGRFRIQISPGRRLLRVRSSDSMAIKAICAPVRT